MKRNTVLVSLLAAGTLIFAACDDPTMDTTTTDPMMPGQTVTEPGFDDPVVTDPATDPAFADDFGAADDALYEADGQAGDPAFGDVAVMDDTAVEIAKQDASEVLATVQTTVEVEQDFDTAASTVEEVRDALADAYQDASEMMQAEWEMLEEQFEVLQEQLEQASMEALTTLENLIAQLETSSATTFN